MLSTQTAFLILKPDVQARDLTARALSLLRDHGFLPTRYRIFQMWPDLFRCLYLTGFHWDLDSWSHNHLAYTFGPCVGLLVRLDGGDPTVIAQNVLGEAKGHAFPELSRDGSLRAALPACNRAQNSFHVADSLAAATREAELVFPRPRATAEHDVDATLIVQELHHHHYVLPSLPPCELATALRARFKHALDFAPPTADEWTQDFVDERMPTDYRLWARVLEATERLMVHLSPIERYAIESLARYRMEANQ